MKLSLLYTYFNGFDQLINSIEKMHDLVDSVVVCYQTTSNKGHVSGTIESELNHLSNTFPNVILLNWEPNPNSDTKQNERDKHNFMIQHIKQTDSTHFIMSACDHVYTSGHIEVAKKKMISENLDICFTKMFTYYKHENWRVDPIEEYFMPFIHKLHASTKIVTGKYPAYVDPSVKVNTCKRFHIFKPSECIMHHYSMVRNDIENKFNNAAASVRWTPEQIKTFIDEYNNAKLGNAITYFSGRRLVHVHERT